MKKNTTKRVFECKNCKNIMIAYKSSNKRTKPGHIKTMYCWKCKNVQDFIQLEKYYY